jgi:hypothetical protein
VCAARLGNVLDRRTCLAATLLEFEQNEWFKRVVGTLTQVYSMPLGEGDARRLGHSTYIAPTEKAARVWLLLIERVFLMLCDQCALERCLAEGEIGSGVPKGTVAGVRVGCFPDLYAALASDPPDQVITL